MKTIKLIFLIALISACSRPSTVSKEQPSDAGVVDVSVNDGAFTGGENVVPPPAPVKEVKTDAALEQYILDSMRKWAPPSTQPDKDGSHYIAIARDIVEVVLQAPPLWKDDADRSRTAILVATIGFWESRYWRHVLYGNCNDLAWRKTQHGRRLMSITGDCDGSYAYGFGQVHPEGGILLTVDGEWKHAWDEPGSIGIGGMDMVKDTHIAIRVVLAMLRKSLRVTGGLVGYTGEGSCPCPKASMRFAFAYDWWRKHHLR